MQKKQSLLTRFFSSGANDLGWSSINKTKENVRMGAIASTDAMMKAIESKMPEVNPPKKRVTEKKTKNISSDKESLELLVTNGINGKKRLKFLDEDDQENNLFTDEEKRRAGVYTAQRGNESMRAKITKGSSNNFEGEDCDCDEDALDDFLKNKLGDEKDRREMNDSREEFGGNLGDKRGENIKSWDKAPTPAEGNALKRKTPISNDSWRAQSKKNSQKIFNFSACPKEKFLLNLEIEQAKNFDIDEFEIPYWATMEKRRDANKRFPWDQDFDPTSLYIPPEEKNKLTPAMKQFWEIKCENMDKIIFFKVGKFYELNYEDAIVGKLILNKKNNNIHQKIEIIVNIIS